MSDLVPIGPNMGEWGNGTVRTTDGRPISSGPVVYELHVGVPDGKAHVHFHSHGDYGRHAHEHTHLGGDQHPHSSRTDAP